MAAFTRLWDAHGGAGDLYPAALAGPAGGPVLAALQADFFAQLWGETVAFMGERVGEERRVEGGVRRGSWFSPFPRGRAERGHAGRACCVFAPCYLTLMDRKAAHPHGSWEYGKEGTVHYTQHAYPPTPSPRPEQTPSSQARS